MLPQCCCILFFVACHMQRFFAIRLKLTLALFSLCLRVCFLTVILTRGCIHCLLAAVRIACRLRYRSGASTAVWHIEAGSRRVSTTNVAITSAGTYGCECCLKGRFRNTARFFPEYRNGFSFHERLKKYIFNILEVFDNI